MKTFDIVKSVIDAKSEELGFEYMVSNKSCDILKKYCDVIDKFIDDQDAEAITADVSDDEHFIIIALDVINFVYEKEFKSKTYLDLFERAIRIDVGNLGNDYMRIVFTFPTVWDEVY